jgi:hypothetical protein
MPQRIQRAPMRGDETPRFRVGLLSLVLLGTTVPGSSSFAAQDVKPGTTNMTALGNVPKSSNPGEFDKVVSSLSTTPGSDADASTTPEGPRLPEATPSTEVSHLVNTKPLGDIPIIDQREALTTGDGAEARRSRGRGFPLNHVLRLIFLGTLCFLVLWRVKERWKG